MTDETDETDYLLVCVEVEVEGGWMVDNLRRNHYLLARLRHWQRAQAGLLLTCSNMQLQLLLALSFLPQNRLDEEKSNFLFLGLFRCHQKIISLEYIALHIAMPAVGLFGC